MGAIMAGGLDVIITWLLGGHSVALRSIKTVVPFGLSFAGETIYGIDGQNIGGMVK